MSSVCRLRKLFVRVARICRSSQLNQLLYQSKQEKTELNNITTAKAQ